MNHSSHLHRTALFDLFIPVQDNKIKQIIMQDESSPLRFVRFARKSLFQFRPIPVSHRCMGYRKHLAVFVIQHQYDGFVFVFHSLLKCGIERFDLS